MEMRVEVKSKTICDTDYWGWDSDSLTLEASLSGGNMRLEFSETDPDGVFHLSRKEARQLRNWLNKYLEAE